LGKRLKYSSCYWPKNVKSLAEAEESMLQLVCQRAQILDGDHIMDLGCGWGSMSFWLCEKYPNCSILAVSNSNTQREYITKEAELRGFASRLKVVTCDANELSLTNLGSTDRFDKIISIEMFEHMKNYERLMNNVSNCLKSNGLLFVQILCHREYAYSMTTKQDDWMGRNFFSGGTIPSDDLLLYFQEDLAISSHWRFSGLHYSKTLEAWLSILDQKNKHSREIRSIMANAYGEQQATKKINEWRLFFIFCSECFGFRNGNEWIVSQLLFHKKQLKNAG